MDYTVREHLLSCSEIDQAYFCDMWFRFDLHWPGSQSFQTLLLILIHTVHKLKEITTVLVDLHRPEKETRARDSVVLSLATVCVEIIICDLTSGREREGEKNHLNVFFFISVTTIFNFRPVGFVVQPFDRRLPRSLCGKRESQPRFPRSRHFLLGFVSLDSSVKQKRKNVSVLRILFEKLRTSSQVFGGTFEPKKISNFRKDFIFSAKNPRRGKERTLFRDFTSGSRGSRRKRP